jgi:Na+/H+ antiporter NhaD/arsenite permease-like protein
MRRRVVVGAVCGVLLCPAAAHAAGGAALDVPAWSVLPFVGLLLCIAVLPLAAGHFWHSNRNRALVSFVFAAPVIGYLIYLENAEGQPGTAKLLEALHEYAAFIILLGSLYTVAGGLLVDLRARPGPLTNGTILAVGAVLANFIGTTGASMVLIRPYLRINRGRRKVAHLPVFFIFVVSNLGGLLTPLGDPPLFLGYLRGVDFFWTLRLWPEWLAANGIVLAVFCVWDGLALRGESERYGSHQPVPGKVSLRGLVNVLLLAGIVAGVLARGAAEHVADELGCPVTLAEMVLGAGPMLLMALLSWALTPAEVRAANGFSWGPIVEVAVLFIGIFVTMVPALSLLERQGPQLGLTEPWQFFWLTGSLSAFLDNAPTYLTFATLAAGQPDVGVLMTREPMILAAISCGAVFMGAMTYIGNGPNFMVKAIAEESGYPTPSFFGYLGYSCLVLLPTFFVVMWMEFTPNLNW